MTGKGQIFWLSGAKYEGEFSGGYLHGFGTLYASNCSVYTGAWRMNIQHGFGKKQYSNSDIYEGLWKEGTREGSGRYKWSSGNIYIGNWKCGKMSGRGVMKWTSGELFDGLWLNGVRHGSGVYRYADGGYYFGSWTKGLKDGKGTFYPAGSKHPTLRKLSTSIGCDDDTESLLSHASSLYTDDSRTPKARVKRSLSEKISIGGKMKSSGRISHKITMSGDNWSVRDPKESVCRNSSSLSTASEDNQSESQDNNTVVYEREYVQGVLIKERMRNYSQCQKAKGKSKFHAEEVKKKTCVGFFEGNNSYYLMLNLQLGIR